MLFRRNKEVSDVEVSDKMFVISHLKEDYDAQGVVVDNVRRCIAVMEIYGVEVPERMREVLSMEIEKHHELLETLKMKEGELELMRDECKHDWEPIGYDSHHNYYRCVKCGKEYRE